ncbi:hypothetical protein ACFL6I_00030 [candidate division KSB1 bacterium]
MKHKNFIALRSRSTGLVLVLIALCMQIMCRDERVELNVENYIRFLEVSAEQEPAVRRHLETARTTIDSYYEKWVMQKASREEISEEEYMAGATEMLKELNSAIKSINEELTETQRMTLLRTELYYFYSEMRSELVDYYSLEDTIDQEADVEPSRIHEGDSEYDLFDWTIFFGQNVFPRLIGQRRMSMSRNSSSRFPAGIQATLINTFSAGQIQSPAGNLPKDMHTEIPVVLYSSLHRNFTKIDAWIIYLELPDGTQIEPVKIVPRDEDWFRERGLLLSNRIPEFLLTDPVIYRGEEQPAAFEPGRSMFELSSAYYQLLFPYAIKGKPLISPANKQIRMVFLEEVGGTQMAEGSWTFRW